MRRILLDEVRIPISHAASCMHISRQSLSLVLHGRRAVTPEIALRFARLVDGNAELYLEMQLALDIWRARQRLDSALAAIEPLAHHHP